MTMKQRSKSVFTALCVGSAVFALQGCWEENEPNNNPEEAYWSGQHVQLWSGDWNWPDPGTLPVPNGQGQLSTDDGVDNWPMSMWNWESGETADDVTSFQGTLWLSAGAAVAIDWIAWRTGDYEEAIWESTQEPQFFIAPNDVEVSVYNFELNKDDTSTLYSLQLSGCGDYGFIIVPVTE